MSWKFVIIQRKFDLNMIVTCPQPAYLHFKQIFSQQKLHFIAAELVWITVCHKDCQAYTHHQCSHNFELSS